jgi:hypothetical protein
MTVCVDPFGRLVHGLRWGYPAIDDVKAVPRWPALTHEEC